MRFFQFFSLPLLTKELIEQAHSKRTYILRVVYAMVLYGLALWQYNDISGGGAAAGFVNLGRGREFFQLLVNVQTWAILLLVPAITCGALTVEKEKDTLALLLLTKLSPWTIIFEKLLSRVFAMGTYQLLSLPLFAIVYGMGGVELGGLIQAVVSLMSLTVAVASVSILCSTWFRTTSEAFIVAYLAIFFLSSCFSISDSAINHIRSMNQAAVQFGQPDPNPWLRFVAALFTSTSVSMQEFVASAASLLIASRVLVSRAFVPPRNMVLELFKSADHFFNELNKRTTGGIVLVPDRETLPLFQAITWRETRKRSLGTFRYQFRILMLLLAPLILVIAAMLMDSRNDFTSPFRGFPVFFWFVSAICLTVHSTGVIPAERIRQSLDVLLVAPLTPAEIVIEKLSGVRRLIKILTVPFILLIVFQAIWTGYILQGSTLIKRADFWLELVAASMATLVFMPLMMWVGFHFGLRLRTQIQAVLATFVTLGAACVIPLFLVRAWDVEASLGTAIFSRWNRAPGLVYLRWLSPLQSMFVTNELVPGLDFVKIDTHSNIVGEDRMAWLLLAVHFVVFGTIWWWLRRNALQMFSKIVRRMETSTDKPGMRE